MKKIMFLFLFILALILLPLVSYADVIYMNDGEEIEGEITEVTGDSITIKTRTSEIILLIHNISKIVYQEILDEITSGKSKKREEIKSELQTLSENNDDITIIINDSERIEENAINVTYDEYSIKNENHRVDGINLKDYYNLSRTPAYKDTVIMKIAPLKFEYIKCEIIDVDKHSIKIKTYDDKTTMYFWKDITSGVEFDVTNSDKEEYPESRKVIRKMLEFYAKQYNDVNYYEIDMKSNNSKMLIDLGVKYMFPLSPDFMYIYIGFSLGLRLFIDNLFFKAGYYHQLLFIDYGYPQTHNLSFGLEYGFVLGKNRWIVKPSHYFMSNLIMGVDYNIILGDIFSQRIDFEVSFSLYLALISFGLSINFIEKEVIFGTSLNIEFRFYI